MWVFATALCGVCVCVCVVVVLSGACLVPPGVAWLLLFSICPLIRRVTKNGRSFVCFRFSSPCVGMGAKLLAPPDVGVVGMGGKVF